MFSWRQFLKQFLAFLVPILYSLLTEQFPEFPLSSDQFLTLIIWAVGIVIGGWEAVRMGVLVRKAERRGIK